MTPEEFDTCTKDTKILALFTAPWCGPCRLAQPVVEKVAEDYKLPLVCVNTDESMDLAMKYNIISIPVFMIIDNGKVTNRIVGARTAPQLAHDLKLCHDLKL